MVNVIFGERFERVFYKIKDRILQEKVTKQLEKIKATPEIGKPMQHERKGTREVYVKPYRLSYAYLKEEDKVIILDLYHKDWQ